jgi:mono/diheme cytochrome c family protein
MRIRIPAGAVAAAALWCGMVVDAVAAEPAAAASVGRGRYLITISGCNDCHTADFGPRGGAVPESEWLSGSPVGFQGPWGTTYPANLRLVVARLTEAQWIEHARMERLPPMPWFNLREMTDEDLRAVYVYISSLGAPGVAAPAYVAPGGRVDTPYFVFVPQTDPPQAASR